MAKRKLKIDLAGERFDKLLVIERLYNPNTKPRSKWLCECDCGARLVRQSYELRKPKLYQGCSAWIHEIAKYAPITHDAMFKGKPTRLYTTWQNMRIRCTVERNPNYKWYGAKGVSVCAEWNDFAAFREWALTHGYNDNLTIERIDPQGNYEPANCEWVTGSENSKRRSAYHKLRLVEHG